MKDDRTAAKSFLNNPAGHQKFITWVSHDGYSAKVCMETTGVYSFLLAMTLHQADDIDVAVVNPRAIKSFAAARMQRGKTDDLDAETILEHLIRMPFEPWHPPSELVLELQLLNRRILQLTTEQRREKSRLHAADRMGKHGLFLVNDIEVNLRHIQRRIEQVEERIELLIAETDELTEQLNQLTSITGIAKKTGPRILAELSSLPSDMTARQWVAYAGLDPRPMESGSPVKPRRISKLGNRYLRDALYLPALVASQRDEHVNAYYVHLLDRGKKPKQAIVAIMRKLLLAMWSMSGQMWQGEKFYRTASTACDLAHRSYLFQLYWNPCPMWCLFGKSLLRRYK